MIQVEDVSGAYKYYWFECSTCGFCWCDWIILYHSPIDIASCDICCPSPPQTQSFKVKRCKVCMTKTRMLNGR